MDVAVRTGVDYAELDELVNNRVFPTSNCRSIAGLLNNLGMVEIKILEKIWSLRGHTLEIELSRHS